MKTTEIRTKQTRFSCAYCGYFDERIEAITVHIEKYHKKDSLHMKAEYRK